MIIPRLTIISGGQTGVDRTALEVAKEFGVPTGGFVPKGYRTDNGPDFSLKQFNVIEAPTRGYPDRTERNVVWADATIIFTVMKRKRPDSAGCRLTEDLCLEHDRPYKINPDLKCLIDFYNQTKFQILNVAGNRMSTHPEQSAICRQVLTELFTTCLRQ